MIPKFQLREASHQSSAFTESYDQWNGHCPSEGIAPIAWVKGSSSYKTIPRCWVKIWVFSSGGQETHSYFLYPNRCSDVCLLDPMNHVSYVHIKVPVLMEVGCLNVWFSTLGRPLPLQELSSMVVADNSLAPNKCSNLCLPRVLLWIIVPLNGHTCC